MNRRDVLRVGLFGGLGGLGVAPPEDLSRDRWRFDPGICVSDASRPALAEVADAKAPEVSGSAGLTRYVDPLPIPPVLRRTDAKSAILELRMEVFRHQAHRDLAPVEMWGYGAMWPGPTLEVRRGEPLLVNWVNALPMRHLLPVDRTIHGAEKPYPEVRTVVHVHGAQVLPGSDGYPDAWISAQGETGAYYQEGPSVYPNDQAATMLWYHDHAVGATRLNIYAGLAGLYLIRDAKEEALNLPSGRFEVPLLIQDRMFGADGSLLYPRAKGGTHPEWIQEFFGDVICVNGKVMPYLKVEPRRYRFRLVNGCNSRFLQMKLVATDGQGGPSGTSSDVPGVFQIGTDAGLLPAPVRLPYLILSPGERADIVLDFSGYAGQAMAWKNDAPAPYPRGGEVVPEDVILFSVSLPLSGKDTSSLPEHLLPYTGLNPLEAVRERVLALTETERQKDGYTEIGLLGQQHWSDPVSEDPKAGSMEIWSFANATEDAHPVHIHLVRFQVINRQPFDVATYKRTGRLILTGRPLPPEGNERPAWKDTVKTYPGYVTRVIQRFDLPQGTHSSPGEQFLYVWHCHMLEHEDNEMMRPYWVIG
jgi:spore coat protein A